MISWASCLAYARLNTRVARLGLSRAWLNGNDFAQSYDRLAPAYDTAWLRQLRPVTDALIAQLPSAFSGRLLDLGCGTGYATGQLAARYPGTPLVAVDFSQGMLDQARQRVTASEVSFERADMLEFLAAQPTGSVGLVFSAWAMGYSQPARLIGEAARTLRPGGWLAFVVNYADTLQPIFRAFRRCLTRFPECVRRAAWLRFPKHWPALARPLGRHGLTVAWHQDGWHEITPPDAAREARLPWLLQTGVLAGFEAMLPLAEPGPVAEHFERLLSEDPQPLRHHYAAALARRP